LLPILKEAKLLVEEQEVEWKRPMGKEEGLLERNLPKEGEVKKEGRPHTKESMQGMQLKLVQPIGRNCCDWWQPCRSEDLGV
jgi:hypothetical protein